MKNWIQKYWSLIALGFTAKANTVDCLVSMTLIMPPLVVVWTLAEWVVL